MKIDNFNEGYSGQTSLKELTYQLAKLVFPEKITSPSNAYCIHHIDLDHTNNSIDNIGLISVSLHTSFHNKLRSKKVVYDPQKLFDELGGLRFSNIIKLYMKNLSELDDGEIL